MAGGSADPGLPRAAGNVEDTVGTGSNMPPLRIAFVTPEFVSESDRGGGLGNYLNRMTKALRGLGHEVEVFLLSDKHPPVIDFEGVRVHRVQAAHEHLAMRVAWRVYRLLRLRRCNRALSLVSNALGLAGALRERERERPFDLVQSADLMASGLFVKHSPRRPHLVRCSSAADLLARSDVAYSVFDWWQVVLERACIRRADAAYAPSHFIADYFGRKFGIDVAVLRPPVFTEVKPAQDGCLQLPERYFIHFGHFICIKGTAVLAEALPLVWQHEPEFTMVWVGGNGKKDFEKWSAGWGANQPRVLWLGRLDKPHLYSVLRRADAAVLPSMVDNLPNTVIESLMFGVPVIGSAGASIDELVEPGVTGELVPLGDAKALANAMLRFWRGQSPVCKGFRWNSAVAESMRPENAVRNLLRFAGVLPESEESFASRTCMVNSLITVD